mgnify:CR=1 FL=1
MLSRRSPQADSLTVEAPGFNRYVRSGITLEVQQQATLDVQLTVGDVSSTVEVTGEAPLVIPHVDAARRRREELRALVDAARQKRRVREIDMHEDV